MSDDTSTPGETTPTPGSIDTSTPHPARVWNYWLGGKDNYAADRQLGEDVHDVFPEIVTLAREGRAFLIRAVRYLAGEAGVRQFLDVGTGMPTANNTHEIAQAIAPESHVLYVDNDPLVLAHATTLLVDTGEGTTDYIHADLREPETILDKARHRLDFTEPIALMLMGILGHIPDDQAHPVTRHLVEALPPGSYLVLWDGASTTASIVEGERRHNETAVVPYRVRGPEEIAAFFTGLEVISPGIVSCPQWRSPSTGIGATPESPSRCGVARKPGPM